MLATVDAGLARSAVKRSLGPKAVPVALMVLESPPMGCGPLPVGAPAASDRSSGR